MTKYIHQLSTVLFFLLGLTFFTSYFLMKNEIFTLQSAWWLQRADLPFALVAILYGGLSLYRSLNPNEKPAKMLKLTIAIPLIAFFVFLVILNYWEVLGLPLGEVMI